MSYSGIDQDAIRGGRHLEIMDELVEERLLLAR
jgi:hypothetical protein